MKKKELVAIIFVILFFVCAIVYKGTTSEMDYYDLADNLDLAEIVDVEDLNGAEGTIAKIILMEILAFVVVAPMHILMTQKLQSSIMENFLRLVISCQNIAPMMEL